MAQDRIMKPGTGPGRLDQPGYGASMAQAGSAAALDLTVRLTEDLQVVARALARPQAAEDRQLLCVQSEALMGLAATFAATRLYLLAEELHDRASDPGCAEFATPLPEMRTLLHQLILSVQATRNAWLIRP